MAMLSICPEAYYLYLVNNVVYIQMIANNDHIDPKILKEIRLMFTKKIITLTCDKGWCEI